MQDLYDVFKCPLNVADVTCSWIVQVPDNVPNIITLQHIVHMWEAYKLFHELQQRYEYVESSLEVFFLAQTFSHAPKCVFIFHKQTKY